MTKKKKILLGIGIVLVILIGGGLIYGNYMLDQINYQDSNDGENADEFFEQDENTNNLAETDPDSITWDESDYARHEDDVINILLVGEEAIGSGSNRGRTDSIMIATINVPDKALKLTSIMRDLYVQIPGYSDNKINAAYAIGGIDLLEDTIYQNFGIKVDGYVKVGFDSFESVIDSLGGVEITLTQKEADYLNSTNYISNPSYRNVVAGTQTLNGNQALGYSRVRYVSTDTQANDFGRTQRQRAVLTAIFEKYKSKSTIQLIALLPSILSLVTTDLTKANIIEYIYLVLDMSPDELETMRIPVDGAYQTARINGMSVLVFDSLSTNVEALQEFIFGSKYDGAAE